LSGFFSFASSEECSTEKWRERNKESHAWFTGDGASQMPWLVVVLSLAQEVCSVSP